MNLGGWPPRRMTILSTQGSNNTLLRTFFQKNKYFFAKSAG
jgi:hypothetical protein